MRRSPLIGGALALALAAAPVAPALASAAGPPAQASAVAPTDGLGATLGALLAGLLGSAQQQQLQQALDQLPATGQPSAGALAPVRTLLDQIAATPGLPASTAALVQRVAALLDGTGSDALAPGLLAPVATLLRDLADTQGVPAAGAQVLDQLADALGSATAGLPIGHLTLAPTVDAALAQVKDALAGGQPLTGAVLAPLVPLLQQIAGAPGLPPALSGLADQLASTLASTSGALDPAVGTELSTLLSLASNTAGVGEPTRGLLQGAATAISPGQPAATGAQAKRAAGKGDRAVIKGVRLNRAHTVARIRIACPRRSPAVCATRVSAKLGGRKAATAKRVRIAPGKTKLVRLRTVRTARASIAGKGGWLRVTVTTTFGPHHYASKKALRIAPPRRH